MISNIIDGFFEFFKLSSFIYMNLGLLAGVVFGCIPGLTVMLCLVLFLPFTYNLEAIDSFMFLLGIYCAGSYGGSISAILINTPGTPHAAATMLDGNPMAKKGFAKKALNIALEASSAILRAFLARPFFAIGFPSSIVAAAWGVPGVFIRIAEIDPP